MTLPITSRLTRPALVLCASATFALPATLTAQNADSVQVAVPPIATTPVTLVTIAPKPFEAFTLSARALRDSVVALAKAQLGIRYRYGGTTPKGFDCSGLVQYIMTALHMELPRTARQQATVGLAITKDTSRLLPGDLLTFAKGQKGAVSHIGIYVGDGKFIHASSAAGKVVESAVIRRPSPLIKAWRGVRRVELLDDSASTVASVDKPKSGSH